MLAKLDSQREAVRYYQRHGTATAGAIHKRISDLHGSAKSATELNRLRGYEGAGSAAWLELVGQLLLRPWEFTVRSRRSPRDPVNALLSLSATWLASRTVARLLAAGVEVALGALHEFRAGRPALACDVMEPLRVAELEALVEKLTRTVEQQAKIL